jgi:metal transporter CNNM
MRRFPRRTTATGSGAVSPFSIGYCRSFVLSIVRSSTRDRDSPGALCHVVAHRGRAAAPFRRRRFSLWAASGGDIGKLEATGVQNFLELDDLTVTEEGEPVHAQSIISLPLARGKCVLPEFSSSPDDPFLQRVNASGKKWVIVTDLAGEPAFVLDSHQFLRGALFNQPARNQSTCWHRPVIVCDMQTRLGSVIGRLKVLPERPDDDVVDKDLILIWGAQRRIITGSDLLGRLLRGIATVEA